MFSSPKRIVALTLLCASSGGSRVANAEYGKAAIGQGQAALNPNQIASREGGGNGSGKRQAIDAALPAGNADQTAADHYRARYHRDPGGAPAATIRAGLQAPHRNALTRPQGKRCANAIKNGIGIGQHGHAGHGELSAGAGRGLTGTDKPLRN